MILLIDRALCLCGTRIGSQKARLAFWHAQQAQTGFGSAFAQRQTADMTPAWPLRDGKTSKLILVDPFSTETRSTLLSLGLFAPSKTSYRMSCSTVQNQEDMIHSRFNRLLQGLRVAEAAGLAHTLCSLYKSCADALSADDYLRNVMTSLKDLSDRILDALRNNRLISSLEKYDTHRMRCVSALSNLKKGHDKLSDELTHSHWTALRPVFENYLSAIQEGNYQSKTALINALLLRLSEDDLATHLKSLVTMQTAVDKLRDAETAFENMQVEYQHQLLEDKTESATDLKEGIIELINQKLVVHLEAKCNEDAATYTTFAQFVDSQIRTENAKLRRRKGKKETSPEIPATE